VDEGLWGREEGRGGEERGQASVPSRSLASSIHLSFGLLSHLSLSSSSCLLQAGQSFGLLLLGGQCRGGARPDLHGPHGTRERRMWE
jgi:hypothetical protein